MLYPISFIVDVLDLEVVKCQPVLSATMGKFNILQVFSFGDGLVELNGEMIEMQPKYKFRIK